MPRKIAAVVGGLIAWSLLFWAVGIGFGLLWPAYRLAAREFFASGDFSLFTVPMMLTNCALFALCGLAAGWLVVRLARSSRAGLAFVAILFAYGALNHFWQLWGVLPDWYNLVVPFVMAGSGWLGARLGYRHPSSHA